MKISAIVIANNEAHNMHDCLNSLRWADEIVVVDSESTDATAAIAKTFTDKVFVEPWRGFGPQKNFAIDRANGDWILAVDADERATDGVQEAVRRLARTGPEARIAGYRIPRRNYFYGRWMRHGGMFPDLQTRLFRKTAGRYDETFLHEHLILDGDVEDLLGVYLDHHSSPTIQRHVRKLVSYTSLGAREKLKTIRRVTHRHLLGHHLGIIVKTLILRRGWKDGVHGCIAAIFAGMHTFAKYAKAYEMLKTSCPDDGGEHGAGRV